MDIKKLAALSLLGWMLLVLVVLLLASNNSNWKVFHDASKYPQHLPDFSQFEDVQRKKTAFFEFLAPVVEEANLQVKKERKLFLEIKSEFENTGRLRPANQRQLAKLIKKYKIKRDLEPGQQIEVLDLRVNTVPQALVLTQAANESAWGTSRFAVEVNNLFGQWCFSKGCGLVPTDRPAGANHEVQRFATVYDAVAAYLRNINTHRAYRKLRKLRLSLVEQNKDVSAHQLAGELDSYSERGEEYVREIRQMIRINELE